MSNNPSPKQEYLRLRRELGLLLKVGRKKERLSAQTIAAQNGLSDDKEYYRFESGKAPKLGQYFKLAAYYGVQIHLSMEFKDANLNKKFRSKQAENSKYWFLQTWSTILNHQRRFHHYSRKELSEMTGIPLKKIKQMEENSDEIEFSLDDACLLMAYLNKSLMPETHMLE